MAGLLRRMRDRAGGKMGLVFHERAFAQTLEKGVVSRTLDDGSPPAKLGEERFFSYTADPLSVIGEVGDWLDTPATAMGPHPEHDGDFVVVESKEARAGEVLIAIQLRDPQPSELRVLGDWGENVIMQAKPAPSMGKGWWSLEFPLFLHMMYLQVVRLAATYPDQKVLCPPVTQYRYLRCSPLLQTILDTRRVHARRYGDKLVVYEKGSVAVK